MTSLVLWVALLVLVVTHVGMFGLGVWAYHLVRALNVRPMVQKAPMSEAKLLQEADRLARQQVNAERYAYFQRNQEVMRPMVGEQVEESFAPSVKPK